MTHPIIVLDEGDSPLPNLADVLLVQSIPEHFVNVWNSVLPDTNQRVEANILSLARFVSCGDLVCIFPGNFQFKVVAVRDKNLAWNSVLSTSTRVPKRSSNGNYIAELELVDPSPHSHPNKK